MHWVAPPEKDTASATLEKRLWDAADQFRANSGLKAQEYSAPVLGLIFLRFAEVRFAAHRARLELPSTSGRGAGGEGAAMFVSSARFVCKNKKNPAATLSIHGVEKTDETGRLCRQNLAVHGLEGDIRHGGQVNSYYDDPHKATGQFDFVISNPPFNVNSVDKERLNDSVGPGRRYPFGLPRTDNANYLWIHLFHSALNQKGRNEF